MFFQTKSRKDRDVLHLGRIAGHFGGTLVLVLLHLVSVEGFRRKASKLPSRCMQFTFPDLETFSRNLRTVEMRANNGARNRCEWLKSTDRDNSNLLQQRTVRVSEQRLFLYQARHHVPAPQTQTKYPNTRPAIQGKRFEPTLHRAWHANAAIIQSQASF